jgi:signal recognition particle receptor subunit beta
MVFLNQTTMQMTAKIVYYGPGLCGKTTNLQWIHAKTAPRSRGEMVSLETEADRTLFFDLLYTVPGQVFYNATRRLVLKGVDGVVFVADSQMAAHEANAEALANLRANLEELGLRFDDIPVVFQYNKRDLNQIQSLDVMRRELNPGGAPDFEAAALHGVGVFETLKTVSRVALSAVRTRVAEENRREPAPPGKVVRPAPPEASSPPPAMPEPKAAASPVAHSLSELVPDPSSIAEVKVEFAEEVTGKFEVRPVATLDRTDLEQELEKLRAAAGRAKASAIASREMDRLVAGLLDGGKGTRQEVKRKATVEVPEKALRGATGFRLNVVLEKDGRDEVVENVLLVKLVGNTRQLDRLNLKLDLDLKGR